jgi:hypothetical protein
MKSTNDVFKFIQASLNLFKAVPNMDSAKFSDYNLNNMKNLENGFFILGKSFHACPFVADEKIFNFLKEKFGHSISDFDPESYDDFNVVEGIAPQQVLVNKILNYLSTYGIAELEQFERSFVPIPNKALGLPEGVPQIKIAVIGFIDKSEIEDLAVEMIEHSTTLSEDTINDLMEVMN